MEIKEFVIEGFANIERVELKLSRINALVALNNYGKSNVISAINFGIDFIREQTPEKNNMMALKNLIPINKNIDSKAFKFEVTLVASFKGEEYTVIYGFTFDWIKNEKSKGQRIKEEYLKAKTNKSDSKFKSYLNRNLKEAFYLPSPTGRCDKPINIQKNSLIINKLKNFDDLFYWDLVNLINELKIIDVNTLQDPDKLFRRIGPNKVVKTSYSLEIPDSHMVGFFIYSLKELKPDLYEIFKDSVKALLPSLENFEPIELDLKKELRLTSKQSKLPLDFPDKLYDIIVKESNNNQETTIESISSGSQKVFYILAYTVAAEVNRIPLITFEELENSIHPGLLQKLLIIIDNITDYTKVIMTSHSPYLIQYLDLDKIKIGIPNNKGLAIFKEIRKTKFNKVEKIAEEEGVSVGDLIFDKMIECSDGEASVLTELCE